jgi:hypothetical protein
MAYVSFLEMADGLLMAPPEGQRGSLQSATYSALEWSVIALGQIDRLSTLRQPGRIAVAAGRLFGARHNPRLADPRLEALRRMAVLSWHRDFAVPEREIAAFTAAGFTLDHLRVLVINAFAAREKSSKRHRR